MLSIDLRPKVYIFPTSKARRLKRRGIYQRFIIACMTLNLSTITRRVIAIQMAKKFGMSPKNAHAHTNIELSESLIPSGIVQYAGTIPATRGPRILQLNGIPCFRLSLLGTLVASCIEEIGIEERVILLRRYLDSDRAWQQDQRKDELLSHLAAYPEFTLELVKQCVSRYLEGEEDSPLSTLPIKKSRELREGIHSSN
jgi:hypothetical protein